MTQPGIPVPALAVRLLGGAAIERDGQPLPVRAGRRHGLALLALLATSPNRSLSRDRITAFLWPEGDAEAVRHRLNVLVYDLRKLFGREAFLTVGDDLGLDPALVWVDVSCFANALAGGDRTGAIDLYRGPLLDGFHLPEAIEFEQWMAGERERLARAAAEALEHLAAEAEAAGKFRLAAEHWRRRVAQDPWASRPALALMRVLAAGGERGEAIRFAELHLRRQREEVDGATDPAVTEFAEQLRRPTPTAGVLSLPHGFRAPERAVPAAALSAPAVPPPTPVLVEPETARRGHRFPPVALVAATLLLLVAIPLARGAFRTPVAAGQETVDRIVILPFTVRGSSRVAYLGDGLVELLSMSLDGAGSVRTADPAAVLAFVKRLGLDQGDPEAGRRVAERFGAGQFILGSVVESGRRLDARATLYTAGGAVVVRAVAGAADDGEVLDLVDGLTRQLLATGLKGRGERLTRLAVSTSPSLPALKAYLDGEGRLRAADYDAAAEAFRRATREDSTFTLAWYRLAVAAEWSLRPHEAAVAAERAVRHADRLPERDRLLLDGWRAYARGDADHAEAVCRRLLDLYPDEIEAWLQLGELRFHYAASRGQRIEVARAAFERALELQPDHEGARVHLARIAASTGDSAGLASQIDYLTRRNPHSGIALEMRALRAFTTGDRAAAARLRPEFRRVDSYTVMGALLNHFYAGSLEGMQWSADLLAEPDRPPEVRTAGYLVGALVDLARGRVRSALAAVARAEALDPVRGAELRAFIATAPVLPVRPGELEQLRAALGIAAAPGEESATAESFFLLDTEGVRPLLRRYLSGLVSASLGDAAAALQHATGVERMASPAKDPSLARDLALGVRAEVHRAGGNVDDAVKALDRIVNRPGYQLVLPSPFHPRVRERFLLGLLLEEAGRIEEARAVYATTGTTSLYDLVFLAPTHLRLAALHERAGDERQAAWHYRRVVELWDGADPEFYTQVALARREAHRADR